MNGFGSFGEGFNQQAVRNQNQRLKLMNAFQQFKNQNPYATAEDFQNWAEVATGGANYWMRGALPNEQQMQRMAQQNQMLKKHEDLMRRSTELSNQAGAAKRIQSIFDQIATNEKDPGVAMQKTFDALGVANDPDQRNMIASAVGDPSARRNRLIEDQKFTNNSRAIQYLKQQMGLGVKPTRSMLDKSLPDLAPEARDGIWEGWEKEQERDKLQTNQKKLAMRQDLTSDTSLLTGLSQGMYKGNESLLKQSVEARVRQYEFDDAEAMREVERVMKQLYSNADMVKKATATSRRENASTKLDDQWDAMVKEQDAVAKVFNSDAIPENVKHGVKLVTSRNMLSKGQMNQLIQMLDEFEDDMNPVDISRAIEDKLGGLTPKMNKEQWKQQQIQRMIPDPMTEDQFNSQAMQNLRKLSDGVRTRLQKLDQESFKAALSSGSHKDEVEKRQLSLIDRAIAEMQTQQESIQEVTNNPAEQTGNTWSGDAGREATEFIQAEIMELERQREAITSDRPRPEPVPPFMRNMERQQQGPPPVRPELLKSPQARAISDGIERAATKYGLPPEAKALMYAIAETESSFNPQAMNKSSGASGAFQFIPGTAKQFGLGNPTDPIASADAAARHLLAAYKRQGNWFDAAVGHHSGPAWKNLGEHGVDYASKLHDRYQKYLQG